MKSSQVLKEVKDVIDSRGWIQGAGMSRYGVCALGGFETMGLSIHNEAIKYLVKTIDKRLIDERNGLIQFDQTITEGKFSRVITTYNDWICKTKEEIMDWFDRAIALAEEDEYGEVLPEVVLEEEPELIIR